MTTQGRLMLHHLRCLTSNASTASTSTLCCSSLPGSSLTSHVSRRLPVLVRAYSAIITSGPALIPSAATAAAARVPKPRPSGFRGLLHDYKQLSKFRLSLLVASTASVGYVSGSGDAINWAGLAWTTLGTLSAAACANSLNQLYEVANDARMKRTAQRPLVTGMLSRRHAVAFAVVTGAAGVGILYSQTNVVAAGLGATNIGLYAAVYTPLKQLTVANTWVGALVGAIPPLMGWAAAADGRLEPGAWALSAALFSWQMPHFFALSWLCKDDYLKGGFRMLPSIDATGRRTAFVALRHSVYLLPIGAALVAAGAASEPLVWEAAALAGVLTVTSARFLASPSTLAARQLFRASLLYLPLLMVGASLHRKPNHHDVTWDAALAPLAARLPDAAQPALASFAEAARGAARAACESTVTVYEVLMSLVPSAVTKCPSKAYSEGHHPEDVEGHLAALRPREGREAEGEEEGEEAEEGGVDGAGAGAGAAAGVEQRQ